MIELVHSDHSAPVVTPTTIILPPDPYWLLRIPVALGECTPFTHMMLWAWQFQRTQGEA
jgi:hypothetical protein